jgi:hypothetical protein
MPSEYVEDLRSYPARPDVIRPTTLVHGMLDVDDGGSAPWRIQEWAALQPFHNVYILDGVDHSLQPWLSAESWTKNKGEVIPTFREIVTQLFEAKKS